MNSLEAAANRGKQGDSGAAWQKRSCAWKGCSRNRFLRPWLVCVKKEINPDNAFKEPAQCLTHNWYSTNISSLYRCHLWERLRAEGEGGKRMKQLDNNIDSMDMSKLEEVEKDKEAWYAAIHGVTKSWTQLSD